MTEEEGLERNATWLALKMEQVDHEPRNMGSLVKMEKEKKKKKSLPWNTVLPTPS